MLVILCVDGSVDKVVMLYLEHIGVFYDVGMMFSRRCATCPHEKSIIGITFCFGSPIQFIVKPRIFV